MIFEAVVGLIVALVGLLSSYIAYKARKTYNLVNHRMDELLARVRAQAVEQGRELERLERLEETCKLQRAKMAEHRPGEKRR